MSWDQSPPEKHELGNWFDEPPRKDEIEGPAHPVVSGVRSLVQSAAGNFSDELAGLIEGGGRAVGIDGLGGPMKDIKLNQDGPTAEFEQLKQAYMRARDLERNALKKDAVDNPIASGAGMVGGALLSPLNKVMKTASLAKSGLVMGGIGGLGTSEADNVGDMALDVAGGAALGGTLGKGLDKLAPILKKGSQFVSSQFADASQKLAKTPVENLDEILAASGRLNIKPVEAMKTSNPAFQKLESGLSQSGSFPAMAVREDYNNLFQGVEKAGEKIAGLRTADSDFAIGQGIKNDLGAEISALRKPVAEMYENVMPDLRKIPVNEKVVNKVIGQMKKDPIFQTADGKAFLEEHKEILLQNPELASLKEYRSTLKNMVNENSLPIQQMRVEALRKAVTSVRDNSINAMKADLPEHMHLEVDDLIDRIALADSAHSANLNDINSIKSLVGNKDIGSPTTFLSKLGNAKESDLATKAGNLDIQSLRNMQQKFPKIFEKARAAKINEMVGGASNPVSGFSDARFFKQYQNLDTELRDLLFDPDMQRHIADLQTVRQAIPPKLGPSGTAEGLMSMDMFNPKRNLYDFAIKRSINGAEEGGTNILNRAADAAQAVGGSLEPGGAVNKGQRANLQLVPRAFESNAPVQLPRAAGDSREKESKNFNQKVDPTAMIERAKGTKYEQVLRNAAQNGEQSFAAAHYVLSQRDPEYRNTFGDKN